MVFAITILWAAFTISVFALAKTAKRSDEAMREYFRRKGHEEDGHIR